MSLISQALRKAQQDRNPSSMATPAEQPMARSQPASPMASSGMKPIVIIGLIVVVTLLVVVIAGLSVVLLKDSKAPIQTAQPAAQPPEPANVTPEPATAPIPAPTLATAPTPAPIPQTNHTAGLGTESSSVINELRLAREAAEAKLAIETEAQRLTAEAEAAKQTKANPSQAVIDWLGQAKITGVRLSSSGNKVILNNKAYMVGDVVHYNLGLKVLAIQETRVLFIDKVDKKYMKRL
ncbi:MAG TPA: hypothetical protein DCX06_12670 [Opitutae bacterium]|nr:hypothetical protein [Opitutae bacterium]